MLRTKPVGPAVISCLAALLLAPMARAQMPVETITAHVDSLDTMLQQAARSSELRSSSLKVTDRYLQTYLRRHTEVSEMLRINSKGKVTSEVVRTGKPGQRYRSVATQGWFQAVSSEMEPYYGNVRIRAGKYQLFWAMPVVTVVSGARRSSGALLVKLDLDRVMATAAARVGQPFMVEFGGRIVHQSQWRGGIRETTLFDVKGLSGAKLITEAVTAPAAAAPQPAPEPAAPAVQPAPAQPQAPAAAASARAPKPRKRLGAAFFVFPVVLVVLALLAVALWRLITRVVDTQQERLLRDIEAQVGSPAPPGTPPPPAAPPSDTVDLESLQAGARQQGGITRRIPVPDAAVQSAPVMGMQAPMMAAPQQQYVPPPQMAPQMGPGPGPVAAAPVAGPEDYERLRQQLRSELAPELRGQLEKEFQKYRMDVERGAEAFGAEVEMSLHQLIGKISEMGDNPTRITEVAGAAIHELNAIVNRYRNQNK